MEYHKNKKNHDDSMDKWNATYNKNFGYPSGHIPQDPEDDLVLEYSKPAKYYPIACNSIQDGFESIKLYSISHPMLCKNLREPVCVERLEIGQAKIKVIYHNPPLTRKGLKDLEDLFPNI